MLKGNKTTSREHRLSDVSVLTSWFNDQEVVRYLGRPFTPMYAHDEEEWIRKLSNQKDQVVFMIDNENNVPIGTIGLHKINPRDQRAILGIAIGDKTHWNKGYGTDAIKVLLRYGFNTLNLRKITLAVFDFNERGMKCYRKCGFVEAARLREEVWIDGAYRDEILMAVFRDEWLKAQESCGSTE